MQRHLRIVAVINLVILPSACVLNLSEEFRYSYERVLIGKSYSETVGTWKDAKESVRATSTGGKIIRVLVDKQCNLFYEVENDKIIRAWDDAGKDCWKVN